MFKNRINAVRSLVAGGAIAVGSAVQAAVPAGAEAVFTTLATDTATILGYAFVAMTAITGGWIVFSMVKRGAKKAAG